MAKKRPTKSKDVTSPKVGTVTVTKTPKPKARPSKVVGEEKPKAKAKAKPKAPAPAATLSIFEQMKATIKFDIALEKIAKIKAKYSNLKIVGVEDKEGFAAVHKAEQEVKGLRSAVEHKRKELNEDSLAYQRETNSQALTLKNALLEIEEPLKAKKKAIADAKEAAKLAAEKAEADAVQVRINELAVYGVAFDFHDLKMMNEDFYQIQLTKAREDFEAEKKAAEDAEILRAQKAAKLAADNAALAAQNAELAARLAAFEAQQPTAPAVTAPAAPAAPAQPLGSPEQATSLGSSLRQVAAVTDAEPQAQPASEQRAELAALLADDVVALRRVVTQLEAIEKPQLKTEQGAEVHGAILSLFGKTLIYANDQIEKLGALAITLNN